MTTLPNSGQLKFSDLRSRFRTANEASSGNKIKISRYYRGKNVGNLGVIVSNAGVTSNIPTSGSIKMSNFRGTGHNFTNNTTLNDLEAGHVRGYVFSHGTRSPRSKVRNYCIIYSSAQNVPTGGSSSSGIYNLSNGKKYAYATMTSGDRTGTRLRGPNFTQNVPSRMYNSAQSRSQIGNATLVEAHNGVYPAGTTSSGGETNRKEGYGRIGTFTRDNGPIQATGFDSDGSTSHGVLLFKNTENNSDQGKGNIVCYVFDYRFMDMLYRDLSGLTGNLSNNI